MNLENGTIEIDGKTVPKIVHHDNGCQTWNLDPETAAAIQRAVAAAILRMIVDSLAGSDADSEFDD